MNALFSFQLCLQSKNAHITSSWWGQGACRAPAAGKTPEIEHVCGLSWKHMISAWSKLSDKLKHGMNNNRPSGFWVIDHSLRNIVLINNSRTTWHNRHNAIYGFLNLLQDAYIVSQEKKCWQFWDNAKKHVRFWLGCISPLISTLGGT